MASNLPHTIERGRIGAAASRASVPVARSISRERMPRPLPMKRNTTAIDGAK